MKTAQVENLDLSKAKRAFRSLLSEFGRKMTPEMNSRISRDWAKAVGLDPTGRQALALVEVLRERLLGKRINKNSPQNLEEHITKLSNGKYRLVSKKSGRNLGEYDSLEKAQEREQQVSYFKAKK